MGGLVVTSGSAENYSVVGGTVVQYFPAKAVSVFGAAIGEGACSWRQWLSAIIFALTVCPGTASAIDIALFEEQYATGPIIEDIRIRDMLIERPTPQLRLDAAKNPEHKRFIDILSAGIPFGSISTRNTVAAALQIYPDICKESLGVALVVGPIEHIDRFVPGVIDKRRILSVTIGNCVAEKLPGCSYDISDSGEVNFALGNLLEVLNVCREALQQAERQGIPYVEAVYRQQALFDNPPVVAPRAFFRSQAGMPIAGKADSNGLAEAHAQIASIRHYVTAKAYRGDAEAAYFRACLNYPHAHEVPAMLGAAPTEADTERPYRCSFYGEKDFRAAYIDSTGEGWDVVLNSFEQAAESKDAKLAARAHWNLAVLWAEAEALPKNNYADLDLRDREIAGAKVEYDGQQVSVPEFRRMRDRDIAAAKAQNTAKAINALNEARRLDPSAFRMESR